ncbi:peptidoglycan-binding protein [Embleya sp. NBC_00896]|uniref:peptidoglycan-binding protein n=1 Tax=Embleya sp. NBC_00896 TaxID=2975961 RepID=UPI00386AB9E2|nr:peptidoglycan-binding protein [Embleya sp. NBC_00896]
MDTHIQPKALRAADEPEGAYPRGRPPARSGRRRALLATVVVAVALTAGGVTAARFIKSPAEKAAEAKAPAASVISAVVERRVLTDTVVLRGRVTAGQTVVVAPQPTAGGGKDGGGVVRSVVTGVRVKAGDVLEAGQVIIEVSGRPVFVLPGELPVYRDLKPGSEGHDVEQLQAALEGLGYRVGSDRAGTYGAGTRAAVAALYTTIGYDAPEAGEGGDEAVRAAEERITSSERALTQAKDTLKAIQAGGSGSSSPATGGANTGGTRQAEEQVRYAEEDVARAGDALAALRAKSGAMLPAAEVVFLSKFPARVDTVQARVGDEVKEKALTISAGDLIVRGQLASHEKGLVRAGLKVGILSELSGVRAEGSVRSIADAPGSPSDPAASDGSAAGGAGGAAQTGAQGYEIVVEPTDVLDPSLAGQDVRLTIDAASSGDPVLVVPLSAVAAGADGRTVVTVLDAGGERRRVEVRPGTSGDGYVEVTPMEDGALTQGDRIVIGAARKAPPVDADGKALGNGAPRS